MTDWFTDTLPDFTVHGFHTGSRVEFRLSNGSELFGVYQGWGIFSANGVDYLDVVAWRAVEDER